jgi:hypothetical protein
MKYLCALRAIIAPAVFAAGAGFAAAATAQTPPPVFQSWLSSLQAQGYTVTQGSALEFTSSYCQQSVFPVFHTCFSSDPGDPYLQPLVPLGAGYQDPYYQYPITLPSGVVTGESFQLNPTEAVVTLVQLPPTAAYFSYQSYLFTRPASDYPGGIQTPSPDPARAFEFATFNNSINMVDILQQSGLGFGQGTVGFITTNNGNLTKNLISSFGAVGGNAKLLFPDQMGSNLHPGLTAADDDFSLVLRYSLPQDTTAGNLWRTNVADNVEVYRIAQPAGMKIKPYGQTTLLTKSYNADETSLASELKELSQLLQGWLATQENKPSAAIYKAAATLRVTQAGVMVGGELGPYCIQHGTTCGADEQDSGAYWGANPGPLAAGQLMLVDGVDHTVTNNATFVSIGANDAHEGAGLAEAAQTNPTATGFTSGTLTGSAAQVLKDLGLYSKASSKLIAALPDLFVTIFTRPCTGQIYCTASYTTTLTTSQAPYQDSISITERAYVLPGYFSGANPDFLLDPYVIY